MWASSAALTLAPVGLLGAVSQKRRVSASTAASSFSMSCDPSAFTGTALTAPPAIRLPEPRRGNDGVETTTLRPGSQKAVEARVMSSALPLPQTMRSGAHPVRAAIAGTSLLQCESP